MRLTIRNLVVNLLYYGLTLFALPGVFLKVEHFLGIDRPTSDVLRLCAFLLGVSGAALQVWCIVLLQNFGKGTPSPVFPTQTLVVDGPYRCVRNPLNLGELMVFGALAAWFGSVALLFYMLLAFVAFHLFVVLWEEPANRRRFGENYRQYEAATSRWLPRSGR